MKLLPTVLLCLLAASCGHLFSLPGETAEAGVSVSNGTTLEVTLSVNGAIIGRVPAGGLVEVPPGELPPLPWSVDARSPSGRLLVTMLVQPGDVDVDGPGLRGTGGRVDLSCGRLDIWSGPPMGGPVPGPGEPGDCEP